MCATVVRLPQNDVSVAAKRTGVFEDKSEEERGGEEEEEEYEDEEGDEEHTCQQKREWIMLI